MGRVPPCPHNQEEDPSPAEQCDDGNVANGDGCSSLCHLELCPPDPQAAACRDLTPGTTSKVLLQKRSAGPWAINSDRFAWKWRGAATTLTEFGDPATTSYQLCLYDNFFATPALRMDLALPAGGTCGGRPCWQSESMRLRYVDPAGTPSGVAQAKLTAGADGRTTIGITGQGRLLAVPGPVDPFGHVPLNFGLAVVLRNNTTGVCWAAGYGAIRNTHGTLRGFTRGT